MLLYPSPTIFKDLRALGYSGSFNDMLYKYLGDNGFVGSLTDRIATLVNSLVDAPIGFKGLAIGGGATFFVVRVGSPSSFVTPVVEG